MDYNLLKQIGEDILAETIPRKPTSDLICALYIDGTGKLTFDAINPALHAFRAFSEYEYPIYIFIAENNDLQAIEEITKKYRNVIINLIPHLNSSFRYNEWMFNEPWYLIPNKHKYCVSFQFDGYPIQKGYEKYCIENNFSFIGARWRASNTVITSMGELKPTYLANGGCSWREISKMREVVDFVNSMGGQHKYFKGIKINNLLMQDGSFLCEDVMLTSVGFHYGIFKEVTINQANKFSLEPITMKLFLDKDNTARPMAFHKVDSYE